MKLANTVATAAFMVKVLFYNIRLPRHVPFTTTSIDFDVFITKTNSDAVCSYSSDILPSGFVSSSPNAGGYESQCANINDNFFPPFSSRFLYSATEILVVNFQVMSFLFN